jgi:predicted O-methyltransferase YrrM
VGPALRVAYRGKTAWSYYRRPAREMIRWLLQSRELTNFTYDLEYHNKQYLASFVAEIAELPYERAKAYIEEIEQDKALRDHIAARVSQSKLAYMADKEVRYGRRVGWYALVRALRPKTVVETGVDKGLGACVLTAALKRNAQDGYPGRYTGIDIDPAAGYLLAGEYAKYGSICYGDSLESLAKLESQIDCFINDSDHSADYEAAEYRAIKDALGEAAVIIGDNAHYTTKLFEFSLETQRRFAFFQEKPRNHWYPGGGIGVAFGRAVKTEDRNAV